MNHKTSKLISRFSKATKRDTDQTKKWYVGLSAPQRGAATKMMRETLGEVEAK